MTRIATYGSNQLYVSRLLEVQQRLHTAQVQVTTEKKSSTYSGIAQDVNRLVNYENHVAMATSMVRNNTMAETRLNVASESITAVSDTITKFRNMLNKLAQNPTKDRNQIDEIQKFAFQSIAEVSNFLGVKVDGQYLFSGGRITTAPIEMPADSLAAFQAKFDGIQNTYPTTRAAHLRELNVSAAAIGTATFDATYGLIKPSKFAAFDSLTAGSIFDVSGSTNNNDTYTHKGLMALNASGTPLTESSDAGSSAFITYNGGASNLLNAATGPLQFAYAADGTMTLTANTGSLSALTVGEKFTVAGSTGSAWDGSYEVSAVNGDVITIKSDSATSTAQTTTAAALTFKYDTGDADSVPEAALDWLADVGVAGTDAVSFSISGNTVRLTAATATAPGFAGVFSAGTNVTIAGSDNHDGTFKVTNATQTTVEFQVSPTAMRISDFVMPQSGRTDVTMSWDSGNATRIAAHYGTLSFGMTANGETITAGTAGAFLDGNGTAYPPVGSVITLASTSGVNDGQYTVSSNDGTHIVIASRTLTAESSTTTSLTNESWYKGDTLTLQHRVDTDRVLDFGMFASDPAFEKALRAMGIIAQGVYGTAGGLENNMDRVTKARFLLNDALNHPAEGEAPFGTEETSDIERIASHIAVVSRTISVTNERHQWFIGFLEERVGDLENVDKTEVITRLLDDQRALEAGYQALSKVRSMNLLDFMR